MKVAERALMLDMARKFYSKDWIIKLIDFMATLEMNTLQLHFSENEGFRIECETYPSIVSEQHLSKVEIREIIDHAKANRIQIIPDFDTPGHQKLILEHFPQYKLSGDERALDITNPEAINFVKKLYQEYAELFHESQYFHIGADEFIHFDEVEKYPQLIADAREKYGEQASGMEGYVAFTNEIAAYVKELGFIPRAWNDGFYRQNRHSLVELSRDIEICYWTKWDKNMAEAQTFIDKGFKLINYCDNYLYYVLGENAGYSYPNEQKILDEWTINRFPHGQLLDDAAMQSVIGVSFAIWSDRPKAQTEAEVFRGIQGPLRAMMQVLKEAERS